MNFLPRVAEGRARDRALPVVHRNVDFDEIAFFHGGSVFGIDLPPGIISHAPQGTHHGAAEKARERSRRRFERDTRVEWKIIAVDTRRRLVPSEAVLTAAAEAGAAPGDPDMSTEAKKYAYERIPFLVMFEDTSAYRDTYGGTGEYRRPRGAPPAARSASVRHGARVHAPDRRRRLPADDDRAGPRRPPRRLLQQPLPGRRRRARSWRRWSQDLGACVRHVTERARLRARSCSPAGAAAARCRCTTSSRPSTRR